MERPSHHTADGRFTNPWADAFPHGSRFALLRWQWHRIRHGRPAAPDASSFPSAIPEIAQPHAAVNETRATWLGQSSFLLQTGGINVLTDPVLSQRASPFAWIGPARIPPAPLQVKDLPPIDAVLISHDHYDHLDGRTLSALVKRFGAGLSFYAPLGHRALLGKLGARNITECDWWETARLRPDVEFMCLPAQHWTRRGMDTLTRLWCSWLMRSPAPSVYFCGDSGYCPVFREIRQRAGAPAIALLPIGAYEPRWFMKGAHMNPEEAVQVFLDLGAREFVAMHWGTFHLTDEPMLEPPIRTRSAWASHHLPHDHLHIPQHGETIRWSTE